jgi:CheY-like chemotaxis protein
MDAENQRKILIADRDKDGCFLAREAFKDVETAAALSFFNSGKDLFNYLSTRSDSGEKSELPDIILFDLNIPRRKHGREVLKMIKSKPVLKDIPVLVLMTSTREKDIYLSVEAGADGFITKPTNFDEWKEVIKSVAKRWPLSTVS